MTSNLILKLDYGQQKCNLTLFDPYISEVHRFKNSENKLLFERPFSNITEVFSTWSYIKLRLNGVVEAFAYEICCQLGTKQFFFQMPISAGRCTGKNAYELCFQLAFSSLFLIGSPMPISNAYDYDYDYDRGAVFAGGNLCHISLCRRQ